MKLRNVTNFILLKMLYVSFIILYENKTVEVTDPVEKVIKIYFKLSSDFNRFNNKTRSLASY